ncbi:hypothetical protein I7I53_09044 [Histoplasma capsulatum var. duboisii H88]|uniref:Uncharacterized protein n=1 Tax=Ajellomyces capsulatus (strain H88) TaxID=544711 RepID=A0A8A1LAR3_AJEC8|nr:hypothetical protein I7I53_09044 [Histoplasma capsulatum var. duboisii H88]
MTAHASRMKTHRKYPKRKEVKITCSMTFPFHICQLTHLGKRRPANSSVAHYIHTSMNPTSPIILALESPLAGFWISKPPHREKLKYPILFRP